MQGKIVNLTLDYKTHKPLLTLILNNATGVEELKDTLLDIDIKKHKEKRSLNCNAYFWTLLQKMAEKLNSSKDELYLEMLSRYGVFTHMIVKENAVNRVMTEWRTCRNLGSVTVNGQSGIQIQCFFGSSRIR